MMDETPALTAETTVVPVKQKRVRKKKDVAPASAEAVDGVAEPVVEVVKVPKKKKYLNNADLMIQIKLSREQDRMTDELANMLTLLCAKYAKHPDYANIYSYVDDMKAFAMLTVVKVWRSFNPDKGSNPFAYFTQILRHAFYQYLNHESKQRTVKDVLMVDIGELPSFTFLEKYAEDREWEDSDDEDEPRVRRSGYDHTAPGIVTEINYAMGEAPEEPRDEGGELEV